ncbi:MAG: cytochrome [Bdellovibrionaceae bacterium]|nr:cytochrome [Pseudobdellovibrionaceae bacterium]
MFLQGDLQRVFDALYHMGVIDPVLKMDWSNEFEKLDTQPWMLDPVIEAVNKCDGDYNHLMMELQTFDAGILNYLAMLVAKELMYFHSNTVIH